MMIDVSPSGSFLPLPACGERVGVRGRDLRDRGRGLWRQPLTLPSRYARRAPPSPRKRGEGTRQGDLP